MNEVAMFDSLQAFKNLQEAGVAEQQAEVFVEEMNKVVASRNDDLATKGDVLAVKADVENLRVSNKRDLAELEMRMVKWVVAVSAILLSALTAATIYLASIGTEILTRLN